jgi:predicted dehydrogenase
MVGTKKGEHEEMKPVKMGFIGTGGIAQYHLRAISNVPEIEVVAAADIVLENAEKTAQRWDIPHVYQDYREMLEKEDIEAVNICTAPTVDALKADKHVIVEKPMAATLTDAVAMTAAAHESDQILMVALKARYSDARIAAQAIADSGTLGDIYYCESVAARRCGIPGGSFIRADSAGLGTVADIGVYSLDAALCIMGHPVPVAVSGIANNILGTEYCKPVMGSWKWDPEKLEVEDFGVASVRFENGALMTFKTAWIMHMDSLGGTFFLGTKAGLRLDPLTVYRHKWGTLTDTVVQNVRATEAVEQFRRENVAFVEAIRENKPSPIPPDQMLLTNVIIQGLIDSAAAGREIEVTVPEC